MGDEKTNPNPASDLPVKMSNPARRALAAAGITSLEQVAKLSPAELLKMHGVGPKTLTQLRPALAAKGLSLVGDK